MRSSLDIRAKVRYARVRVYDIALRAYVWAQVTGWSLTTRTPMDEPECTRDCQVVGGPGPDGRGTCLCLNESAGAHHKAIIGGTDFTEVGVQHIRAPEFRARLEGTLAQARYRLEWTPPEWYVETMTAGEKNPTPIWDRMIPAPFTGTPYDPDSEED